MISENRKKKINPEYIKELLKSNNIFLTGKAGTGKSVMTTNIIKIYKNPIVLASTGMAANNIGGMTVHSFFKLGINKTIDELNLYDNYRNKQFIEKKYNPSKINFYMYGQLRELLEIAEVIIIDEISMISKSVLELIFYRLEQFSPNRKIPILVVGDFYQLPPIDDDYCFNSEKWNFKVLELTEIMRTKNLIFSDMQSQIRKGIINEEIFNYIASLKNTTINPLRIFSRNSDVDEENKKHIDNLPGTKFVCKTIYETKFPNDIQNFKKELKIGEIFEFKIGAKVMSVVNEGKLYNGLSGVIVDITSDGIIKMLTDNEEIINVGKFKFKKLGFIRENNQIGIDELASALQYPLIIAAAITIHKSQGMSIDNLHIDCDRIFEKGQFYTAFSRGRDPNKIKITSFSKEYITTNEKVDKFYKICDKV